MKIPISVIWKLNLRLIIFLIQVRDTLIFLLQTLRYLISNNKSVLLLSQILQFLGVEINSKKNECIPSPGKEGQNYFKGKSVSIKELTQVLVHLSSKAITVLAAPLQF